MPVIPIVGAVVAIGIAAEVGTTLAIVAAVGATVGAVGAITGVKELQIAGTVIGAIGGIGAIAQSTGLLGEVGSFLGLTGSEAGSVTPLAAGTSEVAKQVGGMAEGVASASTSAPVDGLTVGNSLQDLSQMADGSALSGGPMPDVIARFSGGPVGTDAGNWAAGAGGGAETIPTTAPGGASPAELENIFRNAGTGGNGSGMPDWQAEQLGIPLGQGDSVGATQPVNGSVGGGAGADPVTRDGGTPPASPASVDPNAPGGVTGNAPGASQVNGRVDLATPYNSTIDPTTGQTTLTAKANGTVLASPVTGTVDNGGSTWTKILDTLGKPGIGTLASGLVQAGSAFVSGATNSLTPAQVAAYNAQADANLAQANLARQQQQLLQTQMANASAVPTATRRPGGLINSTAPDGTPPAPAAPQVAGQPQPSPYQNTAYGLINRAYTRPQQVTGAPA